MHKYKLTYTEDLFSIGFCLLSTIVLIGIFSVGLIYPQTPFSDFLIHWEQSLDLKNYIKGGGSLFVINFFSNFNLTPPIIGLIINSLSWLIFSAVLLTYIRKKKCFYNNISSTIFLCLYFSFGWHWVGYGSTLAIMPLHLATLVLGLFILRFHPKFFVLGIFFIAISFSIRVQSAIGFFVGLIFVIFFIKKYLLIHIKERRFLMFIIISIFLSLVVDMSLRSNSDLKSEIKRSDRAQIFNGLVAPFAKPNNCGGWSRKNWDTAYEYRNIPVISILKDRLGEIVSKNTLLGFKCKITRQLKTVNYVWWIQKDPKTSKSVIKNNSFVKYCSILMNFVLKFSIIFFIIYMIVNIKKTKVREMEYYFSSATFVGLLILTTLLEYNSRYSFIIFGYFLLMVVFFVPINEKKNE
jgi:hypothetical protein